MTFSYDRAGSDIAQMARANWAILLTVAGALVFLPDFARTLFIPGPKITEFGFAALAAINAYFLANWLPIIAASLVMRWGEATLFVLLLDTARPTVADALMTGLRLLPLYFLTNALVTLIALLGFAALIVPGIYLVGRLTMATPAVVAERIGNPLRAVERSFALSRGNGWGIAGLVFLVAIVTGVVVGAVSAVLTVVAGLAAPAGALPAFKALIDGIASTSSALAMLMLAAAVYRQLAPGR